MLSVLNHIAFIGPGGPEFLVIMLVLLLMFGAKDAPRIFRKMNELLNQVRNTADNFKREVMYGDLNNSVDSLDEPSSYASDHQNEYDYESEYNEAEYYGDDFEENEDEERDYSDETFHGLEKSLEDGLISNEETSATEAEPSEEGGDVSKA